MFIDDGEFGSGEPREALAPDTALLLWSLRRLVLAWPRDHAVEAALHRRYGDAATAVAALLRCWLCALAGSAGRQLRFGEPPAGRLTTDEHAMIAAWQACCSTDCDAALRRLAGGTPPYPLQALAGAIAARLGT